MRQNCDGLNISNIHVKSEYNQAYNFEIFDAIKVHDWFVTHRWVLYVILTVYLLGIYFGKKWMETRPDFQLNKTLIVWNAALAIFSIAATLRGYPEAFYLLSKPNGLYLAACSQDFTNWATAFWGWMFVMSKIFELGDTAFIILRKQKLILLHWFHHATVLYGCWIAAECVPAAGRFYIINTFVHSFMYSYYVVKALKINVPKRVSMAVTILQIVQFIGGLAVGIVVYSYVKIHDYPCRVNNEFFSLFITIGPAYLFLFIRFFIKSYVKPNPNDNKNKKQ